ESSSPATRPSGRRRSWRPRPITTTRPSSPGSPAGWARRWSASTSTSSRHRTGSPNGAGEGGRPPPGPRRADAGRVRSGHAPSHPSPRRGARMVSSLGSDWTRGADGVLFRTAARVLLFDEADRLLLVRGHDADDPGRSWWFTIGGGIDPGE